MPRTLAAAAAAAVLASAAPAQDPAWTERLLPDLQGAETVEVPLTPGVRRRLAERLGEGAPLPEGPVRVTKGRIRRMFPKEGTFEARAAAVRCEGPSGPMTIGAAILPELRMIVRASVLEHAEPEGFDPEPFLSRFEDLQLTAAGLGTDAERTDEALRIAAADGEGEIAALLAIRRAMSPMTSVFSEVAHKARKRDPAAAESAAALRELLEKVERAAPRVSFLDEQQARILERIAGPAARSAARLRNALAAQDYASARRLVTDLSTNGCMTCHGSFQSQFQDRRDAVGLGTGILRPGVDLGTVPGLPEPLQAGMARAVRAAILIALEAP